MGFWESLVMTIFAKKVLKEVSNEFSRDHSVNGRHSGGLATYQGLRNTYYDIHQIPSSLLNELFHREPDFIDKTYGEDARELLNVEVISYEYRGHRVWGENWFTISAKYRFLYKGLLSSIMDQNIRDYEIIDYSERPFEPVANPSAHSITIGDYTLYFKHTLYYNLALMLLLDSDKKFSSGHRVANRAIRHPLISLNNSLLQQHGVSIDVHSREGIRLTNASYAVLDDYNGDDFHNTSSGTIEVRVIDGRVHKSDYDIPYSLGDLITNKQVWTGFNDLAFKYPELVPEWDESNPIPPNQVLAGSTKDYVWRCSKGHVWEASVYDRVHRKGCPYCTGARVLAGFNDLATTHPELAKEWDYEENELLPQQIMAGSSKKVSWKCSKCGGKWPAIICSRRDGRGCPYCAGKRPLPGKTDFATVHKELAEEWDYEENGYLRPEQFLPGSREEVRWKCKVCGYKWKARIASRSKGFRKCPNCN